MPPVNCSRIVILAVLSLALASVATADRVESQFSASPATAGTAPFIGAWRLVSFTSFDADSRAPRPGAYDTGIIIYDASGRMTAQLMHSSNRADRAPSTTDDRAAAYRRYLGYWGPFTVDTATGVVVHHVEGSSNPSWVGSKQIRHFSFAEEGTRLTLSVKSGDRVTSTLVWERLR
jgi:hypothetical protein